MTLETIAYSANKGDKVKANKEKAYQHISDIKKTLKFLGGSEMQKSNSISDIKKTKEYGKIIKEAQRYQKLAEDCKLYKKVAEEIEQLESVGIILTPEERLQKALEMLEELIKKEKDGTI